MNLVERVDVSLREFVDGLGRKSECIFDKEFVYALFYDAIHLYMVTYITECVQCR